MSLFDTTEGLSSIGISSAESAGFLADYLGNDVRDTTLDLGRKPYSLTSKESPDFTDSLSVNKEIVSGSSSSPTYQLIQQLQYLLEISNEKEFQLSQWPTETAFRDAREFILRLPLKKISSPRIRLSDDGEINFLWSSKDYQVDLGFYGTETYSYFGRNAQGKEIMGEDELATLGLADSIIRLLAA